MMEEPGGSQGAREDGGVGIGEGGRGRRGGGGGRGVSGAAKRLALWHQKPRQQQQAVSLTLRPSLPYTACVSCL